MQGLEEAGSGKKNNLQIVKFNFNAHSNVYPYSNVPLHLIQLTFKATNATQNNNLINK